MQRRFGVKRWGSDCVRVAAAAFGLLLVFVQVGATAEDAMGPARLSVDRIYDSDDFRSKGYGSAHWQKQGGGYTMQEDAEGGEEGRDIVRYDPATGEPEVLVPASRLVPVGATEPLSVSGRTWSADGTKLLIFTNTKRVWRNNTRGDYWVLDRATWDLRKLGGDADDSRLMFAKFSPSGDRVAYVYRNNIYVQDLKTLRVKRLTKDGSDTIVNGTSDWLYEEELFLRDCFRWSPDGRFIAYWQFDTEGGKEFELINYTDSLYPKITSFPYPKVGEMNSAVRVGVVKSKGGRTRWFKVPGDPRNHYLSRMDWADNSDEVVIQQFNRLQNTNKVMLGDARTGLVEGIITERDDAWVDLHDEMCWLDDGKNFIWLSERGGWRQIYRISRSGATAKLITPGAYDVIRVSKVDEEAGWLYYIASPDDPTQRYLYRTRLDGQGEAERLTPTNEPGTHGYQISKDAQWAIHTYSTFHEPSVVDLIRLPNHARVRMLEDNTDYREIVAALDKGPAGLFRIDIGDGMELDGWYIRPPDFDASKKYPLLFYVYGEPWGQTVTDSWGGSNSTRLWHMMLAQQGYVVVSIDNRGTRSPRGREWRKSIYRQVGILASADQAAATKVILKEWPFIDVDRIGIWGWSGGGSMSLNAIFRYPEIYSTAIAIAFVSNQLFYDTAYQERYMGLPDDNEEGYTQGSPVTFAHQLEGNLLMIHGTADDNVHFQSFQVLANELIKEKKHFTMMAYPNRSHSISEGEGTARHLRDLMTRYLHENLPVGGAE
jgi:dipeptidyl-peptidase-4